MLKREFLLSQAKLAHDDESYDDMLKIMQKLATLNVELTLEERDLFIKSLKNTIQARRSSIQMLKSKEKDYQDLNTHHTYQMELEREEGGLRDVIDSMLKTLNEHLMPNANDFENIVFFYKLNGDYYRYLAEIAEEDFRHSYMQAAMNAYKNGCDVALDKLNVTNTVRLSLLLNFSVFFYELVKSPERAIAVVDATCKDIIASYETPNELGLLYIQMLQQNRDLWQKDLTNDKN